MVSYIFAILSASLVTAAPAGKDFLTRLGLVNRKIFGAQDAPGVIDILLDKSVTDGTVEIETTDEPRAPTYPRDDTYTPNGKAYRGTVKDNAYSYDKSYSCRYNCESDDE